MNQQFDQLHEFTNFPNMAPIDEAVKYLQSLNPAEKVNITKTAKFYGVNRTTLSKRYRVIRWRQD